MELRNILILSQIDGRQERMARCPECGSWIWPAPARLSQEVVCPRCGAILKMKESLGGIFLGHLEVVGTPVSNQRVHPYRPPSRSSEGDVPGGLRSDLGDATVAHLEEDEDDPHIVQGGEEEASDEERISRDKDEDQEVCEYCHAPISVRNARFCSNCGASLSYGSIGTKSAGASEDAKQREPLEAVAKQEEDCIVCSLRLTKNDDAVWCPYCGGLAHRNHMLDWVQTKGCCPRCNRPLNEEDYKGAI